MEEQQHIFTVTEINSLAGEVLKTGLRQFLVEGEISNLYQSAAGHFYFTIKDEHSAVACVFFRMAAANCQLENGKLENGLKVVVSANCDIYAPRGSFQLQVAKLFEVGQGALEREFRARLERLHKDGITNPNRKRNIPEMPAKIGLISSPTAAAVRDVLITLKRRNPSAEVILYPCLVQGKTAPEQILQALARANRRRECDVLLLVRGGGSLEDLWAFNDEKLARAIAASDIPTVSGVGHEIDVTLIDFAVDYRAATPTAAAEKVSPDLFRQLQIFDAKHQELLEEFADFLLAERQNLSRIKQDIERFSPQKNFAHLRQKLDDLERRLNMTISSQMSEKRMQLNYIAGRLDLEKLQATVKQEQEKIRQTARRLDFSMTNHLQLQERIFTANAERLEALSPLKVLTRGYSIVQNAGGKVIKKATDTEVGEFLTITMQQKQSIYCQVLELNS
ncbi:MAG: exodeoxyribonuclease VII large subunit [Cardiobacteriaceae bacterium]|nr:exodeoxyribonuclease VII large subunit [Cardiobacteriaceae bacterium]